MWYEINNIANYDSPALVIYEERVKQNIAHAIQMAGDASRLRPHVKTNKIAEVCQLMLDAGITKFKCATIAEAEMLAMIKAPDVLLALQPVAVKIERFINLVKNFPGTKFSCLVDDVNNVEILSGKCGQAGIIADVFIDLNVGMNRTGIAMEKAFELFSFCMNSAHINPVGLHGYDGHVIAEDTGKRKEQSDAAFNKVNALADEIFQAFDRHCIVVVGGSPAFPVHAKRLNVECSPGTFVFWDWGYANKYPEQPFQFAALVIARIISIPANNIICVDMGHKAVASEMPFPRVHFLNLPAAIAVSHSEEHLVLQVENASDLVLGQVLYGVPVHICPTVALHENALVVLENKICETWQVIARKRSITV